MPKIPGLDNVKFGMLDRVRDTVSGYEGKITGVSMYLNGCVQFSVAGPVTDPGQQPKSIWIDEVQLDLVEAADSGKGVRAVGGPTSASRPGE